MFCTGCTSADCSQEEPKCRYCTATEQSRGWWQREYSDTGPASRGLTFQEICWYIAILSHPQQHEVNQTVARPIPAHEFNQQLKNVQPFGTTYSSTSEAPVTCSFPSQNISMHTVTILLLIYNYISVICLQWSSMYIAYTHRQSYWRHQASLNSPSLGRRCWLYSAWAPLLGAGADLEKPAKGGLLC